METTDKTHAIITPAGTHHLISQETVLMIEQANTDDLVELDDGTKVKLTMATIILPLDKYYEEFPDKRPAQKFHSGGQVYTWDELKSLPGIGLTGIISREKRLKGIELMAKGLKKAKAKLEAEGRTAKNIDGFLESARQRYLLIKAGG